MAGRVLRHGANRAEGRSFSDARTFHQVARLLKSSVGYARARAWMHGVTTFPSVSYVDMNNRRSNQPPAAPRSRHMPVADINTLFARVHRYNSTDRRYVYSRSGVNVLAGPRDPMMCDTRASYATRNGKACRVRGKIRIDRIVNPDPLCGFASRCTEMTLFANALEHPPSLDIAARFITMYCFYATERCKIDTKSIP